MSINPNNRIKAFNKRYTKHKPIQKPANKALISPKKIEAQKIKAKQVESEQENKVIKEIEFLLRELEATEPKKQPHQADEFKPLPTRSPSPLIEKSSPKIESKASEEKPQKTVEPPKTEPLKRINNFNKRYPSYKGIQKQGVSSFSIEQFEDSFEMVLPIKTGTKKDIKTTVPPSVDRIKNSIKALISPIKPLPSIKATISSIKKFKPPFKIAISSVPLPSMSIIQREKSPKSLRQKSIPLPPNLSGAITLISGIVALGLGPQLHTSSPKKNQSPLLFPQTAVQQLLDPLGKNLLTQASFMPDLKQTACKIPFKVAFIAPSSKIQKLLNTKTLNQKEKQDFLDPAKHEHKELKIALPNYGELLASAAEKNARKAHARASKKNRFKWCYREIKKPLEKYGITLSGGSAYMAANQLAKSNKVIEVTSKTLRRGNLSDIQRGDIVVHHKSSRPTKKRPKGYPDGHIGIALGKNKKGQHQEASDHVQSLITGWSYGGTRVFRPIKLSINTGK